MKSNSLFFICKGEHIGDVGDYNPFYSTVITVEEFQELLDNYSYEPKEYERAYNKYEKNLTKVILKNDYDIAITTLKKIANEDYRGNRSQSSIDAYNTLKELNEIK